LLANGVIINARHTFFGQVEKPFTPAKSRALKPGWWLTFSRLRSLTPPSMIFTVARCWFSDRLRKHHGRVFQAGARSGSGFCSGGAAPADLIIVPLLIKLTSPTGPFRQRRCGLNGRPFTMLKFRTMVSDAEQRKQELAALNEMGGPVFKLSKDPASRPWAVGCADSASMRPLNS
jgi:hypothetical protein